MTAPIRIVVLGKPVGWKRVSFDGRSRRRFVDPESENYRAIIREAARPHIADRPLWEGKIRLSVIAYWSIPTGWPQWRLDEHRRDPEPCVAGADMDNILKAIKDALQGVVFRDDRQIVAYGACGKFYADRPRAEIELVEIEPYKRARPPADSKHAPQVVRAAAPLFAGAAAREDCPREAYCTDDPSRCACAW